MTLIRLRSAPARMNTRDIRIDREQHIIRDVVAMQANIEALGHGVQADRKTLEMLKTLGNNAKNGIRQNFGHPGMSENAMGKKISIARNFRVVGDALVHDMHLLPSAKLSPVFARDPIAYIFDMAETNPTELGESVVILTETVWTLPDGRELDTHNRKDWEDAVEMDDSGKRPKEALTPLPVLRPVRFSYVDVVSEGALTHNGLFEAQFFSTLFDDEDASIYAEEAFELVDRWRTQFNIPLDQVRDKVNKVTSRYLFARGHQEENPMTRKASKVFKLEEDVAINDEVLDEEEDIETTGDDPLASAEAQADETEQVLDDAPAESNADADATGALSADVHAEALSRIEALEALVMQMSERLERVVTLTTKNTDNIAKVARDVRRIDGEPVQRMSVRGGQGMSMASRAPVPPPSFGKTHAPGVVTGIADDAPSFDADPEGATLAAVLRRQAPR